MKKIIFLLICFIFISSNVNAQNIKLVTGEWSPYTSNSLQGKGFITEIISLVFKEIKLTPEYEFYKWKRCYSLVKRGEVWGAFPYSFTEQRAKEVFWSDTIGTSRTVFFSYNPQKDYKYNKLKDLKSYKIGGVKGYFYEEEFTKAGLNVSYTSDELSALKRLIAGRIELIPFNELVGWELIRKNFPDKINNFKTLDKAYDVNELKLIVSKDYPDSAQLLKKFNNALQIVKQSENYNNILRHYGLKGEK